MITDDQHGATFVDLAERGVVTVEWHTGFGPFVRHNAKMTSARLDGALVVLTSDDGEQWRCRAGGTEFQVSATIAGLVASYGEA